MNNRLLRVAGSASAKTCSGVTLCGLQSIVTSRSCRGRVAGWLESGAMSPRAQNAGVQAEGWHVAPVSGSVCGGTGVGAGHVWFARAIAGIERTRATAAKRTVLLAFPIFL